MRRDDFMTTLAAGSGQGELGDGRTSGPFLIAYFQMKNVMDFMPRL